MRKCVKCGTELEDKATMCHICGTMADKSAEIIVQHSVHPEQDCLLGWYSIFAGLYLAPVGWILGYFGLSKAIKNNHKKGIRLNIIGLLLSTVALAIWLLLIVLR